MGRMLSSLLTNCKGSIAWLGLVFALALMPSGVALGQSFTNVEATVKGSVVTVSFELTNTQDQERYKPELTFQTANGATIHPKAISGDTGYLAGSGTKQIHWDIAENHDRFYQKMKPELGFADIYQMLGGPENALLSTLVPGLGAHAVYEKRESYLNYRTAVVYGVLGYGLFEYLRKEDYYDQYKNATEQDAIDNLYAKANDAHKRSHYALLAGGALWAADIVTTMVKGFQNKQRNENFRGRNQSVAVNYDPRAKQFLLGVKYQF